ncbi:MAG: quinolinate synthase [Deltaproteobacteria bacterium GWA2_47_9]|nr:MAG: quinolinate synthase [Deltaproteobacteria bacterium GWA2_47_9]
MTMRKLKSDIRKLLVERNAILLAHNYQRDEIQEVADLTGDSLGLSIEASKTEAKVIVFCGVHFMAESASILSPDKTVIFPRMDAGCPMADMITRKGLKKMKEEYPGLPVVTYVNSAADVKAVSDICCTSANAVSVVKSLKDAKRVIMTPDRNLSHYVTRFVKDKEIIAWDGFCPTHERLVPEDVLKLKVKHPNALFVAHPECRPEVVDLADKVASTSGMYVFCRESKASEFIIGTEMGILWRLKKDNPDKKFYLASKKLICPNMKLTTLEDILVALEKMENIVSVPEDIRIPAKMALDRMLAVPRD